MFAMRAMAEENAPGCVERAGIAMRAVAGANVPGLVPSKNDSFARNILENMRSERGSELNNAAVSLETSSAKRCLRGRRTDVVLEPLLESFKTTQRSSKRVLGE